MENMLAYRHRGWPMASLLAYGRLELMLVWDRSGERDGQSENNAPAPGYAACEGIKINKYVY